jgi:hypothetical protein
MTIYLSDDEANVFYNIFCCKRTDFSFKYLGDPLHHTKLRKEDDHQKGGWHLSARCSYSLFNQQRKPAAAACSEELAAAAVPPSGSYCSTNKGNQQQQRRGCKSSS